jgi:hypothetical protein
MELGSLLGCDAVYFEGDYRRFGGAYRRLVVIRSSEALVTTHESTRPHNPENVITNCQRREISNIM